MQHVIIQDIRPRHEFHAFLKLDHYSEVGQLADVIDLILNLSHLVLLLSNAVHPLVQKVAGRDLSQSVTEILNFAVYESTQ